MDWESHEILGGYFWEGEPLAVGGWPLTALPTGSRFSGRRWVDGKSQT